MGNTTLDKNQASTYLLPVSNISIADLFSKINIKDENFFKYIPDGFLNDEQTEANEAEIAAMESELKELTQGNKRVSQLLARNGLQLSTPLKLSNSSIIITNKT